ncbi:phosphoglycerate kinase [Holotrichia oblita]|nr:phosphoglycerate kinase [Holotrichia oblita]
MVKKPITILHLQESLASLAQIFVNDAFGTAHRAHASTEGVATFLPAVSGLLIEKELSVLGGALENPKRPLVVVLGGAKVSDKIGVVNNLLNIAHTILIGGGMMFTFIKAMGGHVGKSKVDNTHLDFCKEVLKKAKQKHVQIVIAQDCVAGDALSENSNTKVVASNKIPDDLMGLDIGPKSIKEFETILKKAGTVVWNGPLGVFEWDKFAAGTNSVATTIAASKVISIVCGGDTAFAVTKLNIGEKFTHISTGGGASLEFFEGKDLPGIAALNNKR